MKRMFSWQLQGHSKYALKMSWKYLKCIPTRNSLTSGNMKEGIPSSSWSEKLTINCREMSRTRHPKSNQSKNWNEVSWLLLHTSFLKNLPQQSRAKLHGEAGREIESWHKYIYIYNTLYIIHMNNTICCMYYTSIYLWIRYHCISLLSIVYFAVTGMRIMYTYWYTCIIGNLWRSSFGSL